MTNCKFASPLDWSHHLTQMASIQKYEPSELGKRVELCSKSFICRKTHTAIESSHSGLSMRQSEALKRSRFAI